MRVFRIGSDDHFTEYKRLPFEADHEERVLEKWLKDNPDGILEGDRVMIIGRQVQTDLGGYIDLLGVDHEGNTVVIELKRDRTPRETIAQALDYAAFVNRLDGDQVEVIYRSYLNDEPLSLADDHRQHFDLDEAAAVAFNKDQRIVVVGQYVTPAIRQAASFLGSKGIRVTCVEFTFFEADGGSRLLSHETVVGEERSKPRQAVSRSLPVVSEDEFLDSCDEHGKAVFSRILDFARRKSMAVQWGVKGFSLGIDAAGTRVVFCTCYPPSAPHKQSFRTWLRGQGGVAKKTAVPRDVVEGLRQRAEETGLFRPSGRDFKCQVDRAFLDHEIDALIQWLEAVEQAVTTHGLEVDQGLH